MRDNQGSRALPHLWILWAALLAIFLFGHGKTEPLKAAASATAANNIILFIGDGMGPEHVEAGGMYANGAAGSLVFESFPNQTTMTHDSRDEDEFDKLTDSAASATAMATGVQVENGVISVRTPGNGDPLLTLLEIYKTLGKSSGLVSTSTITDASPAAFGAHEPDRDNRSQIFEDYIMRSKPTLFLGGGGSGFDATAAQDQGYVVVTDRSSLLGLNTESAITVAGGFGSAEIPAEGMDGRDNELLPTLPEMTKTALDILDNDPDGFFLVVEHEGTDTYSHSYARSNEGVVRSVEELDAAVLTAKNWMDDHPDTIILVVADHETGGLTVDETTAVIGQVPPMAWSTGGHTHTPVRVFATGVGASQIGGSVIANTDIFDILGPESSGTVSFQDGVWPTSAYNGTRDAMIAEALPTINHGSSASCIGNVAGNDQEKTVLLSWDISSINASETVSSATITLNISTSSADQYGLNRLKRPWQEMLATWQKYDSIHGWNMAGAKGVNDRDYVLLGTLNAPSNGQTTITLNSEGLKVVQGWVDGTISNNGLLLTNSASTAAPDFDCRESTTAANRPKLTISYGSASQTDDLVDWIWSGAVTTDSAVVNAKVKSSSDSVALVVSEYNDLSSPVTLDPLSANSGNNNTVSFDLSGLTADRQYHYAIKIGDDIDDLHRGTFRTFADGPFSFTIAISGDAEQGSNMPIFDVVREEQARFFISPGDFMYSDIGVQDKPEDYQYEYRTAFADTLSATRQSALYRSLPIAYMWDDHDYADNNSDKNEPGRQWAREAYQEIVPHYPLGASDVAELNSTQVAGFEDVPIYQSFKVGRAYFIMTDLRSERDPTASNSIPGRSMMGAEQKKWFKEELIYARAERFTPIFWVSSVPWISDPTDSKDHWGNYVDERAEIANFIADNDIQNVIILAADAHMIALDDGRNSDYADEGGAAMPVFQAAPMNRIGSFKGGPYSHGKFKNDSADIGQYALVQVTDTGGDVVDVRFIGKRYPADASLNSPLSTSAVAATTTLINWDTPMTIPLPLAVTLRSFSAGAQSTEAAPAGLMILLICGVTLGMLQTVRKRR